MENTLKNLKPARLWHYFYELSQIPRESKHEKQATEWLKQVAQNLKLNYSQDQAGNVVIRKPASAGYEKRTPVVLQGHVDMVCEKNSGTEHDFAKDPIKVYIDGEYVRAQGTTLGADNGIGVAAALAVLEDRTLQHPPLEALFTIDEETGLTGANMLQPGFIQGKILLNCDSEEDDTFFIGCAGGRDTEITFEIEWESAPTGYTPCRIQISGLMGGHSGLEINKDRANAIKQLNRILWKLAEQIDFRIFSINGGSKHNAIPRESEYDLLINGSDIAKVKEALEKAAAMLQNEYKNVEREVKITLTELAEYPSKVFQREFQQRILNFIYALPHGVKKMSASIPGLVETSTNAAIVRTTDNQLSFLTSQRSSVASEIIGVSDKVKAVGLLARGKVRQGTGYPAWTPNINSPILKLMSQIYEELFGQKPQVKAIHAGLECGIIGEKNPGMDMISFGPTIHGAHSPDECVHIPSVEKFYHLLTTTLRRIP